LSLLPRGLAYPGIQLRCPIHRRVPATPGAVRDIAPEEDREQECFYRIDRRLQFGRALAVILPEGAERAGILVDVTDFYRAGNPIRRVGSAKSRSSRF